MRRSWWTLFSIITVPIQLTAQTRVEIGPLLGYYRPYGSFEAASVYSTSLPISPEALSGQALGGEARIWFGKRFGVTASGSVANSTGPLVITPGGHTGQMHARVSMITTQALVTVLGKPGRNQLWVSGGVGALTRGGDAYAHFDSPTDWGPVAGAGGRVRLVSGLSATGGISALTYMYDLPMPASLAGNPGSLQRGRQFDVLYHLGLSWTFDGH